MSLVRLVLKLPFFFLLLLGFLITGIFISFFPGNSRRLRFRVHAISFWCKHACRLLGIKILKSGSVETRASVLYVSNHLSYLDVLILSSYFPACFVTSVEMKQTPFLGQLCLIGGCIFVERRGKKTMIAENRIIAEVIRSGISVFLFPEATSGNGENILKFRRGMFQSTAGGLHSVQPISINYLAINGQPTSRKNRDKVFWYGDMPFFSHILGVLSLSRIDVEIHILEQIKDAKDLDTTVLADRCYNTIRSKFRSVSLID